MIDSRNCLYNEKERVQVSAEFLLKNTHHGTPISLLFTSTRKINESYFISSSKIISYDQ